MLYPNTLCLSQGVHPREDVVGVEEAVSVDGEKEVGAQVVEEEDQIAEEDVVGEKTKN